jgi:murein DD-endopeptidase MepM/ murein hydrolase activator NlpD
MSKSKVLILAAAFSIWLALALPAGAEYLPEFPGDSRAMAPQVEAPAALSGATPPQNQTVPYVASTSPSSVTSASSGTAFLPHKALEGRVVPEPWLAAPHFSLARPFSEPYRQSPEPTYPYGSRGDGRYVLHTGVDIANPLGTPVRAVADGEVVYSGDDAQLAFGPRMGYYGNLIITRLDSALETEPIYVLFGHLDQIKVAQGQRVSAGDVIGIVGMTGIAIGPHLHLEVRQGDIGYPATRNPGLWLSSLPGRGTLAGRIVDEAGQPVHGERLLIYQAAAPGRVWRVVKSYLESPLIQGDDAVAENFVLPDMPAGDYRIVAGRSGGTVQIPVRIESGRLTLVEIRVQSGS